MFTVVKQKRKKIWLSANCLKLYLRALNRRIYVTEVIISRINHSVEIGRGAGGARGQKSKMANSLQLTL